MRLLFLCSSLEPGRDGVGDYARLLAEGCTKTGRTCALLALNDPFVFAPLKTELSVAGGRPIPMLRLPVGLPWRERMERAVAFRDSFRPDWVSLQLVAYAFHPRGLLFGMIARFRKIIGPARVHIMFHELWLGGGRPTPLLQRLNGIVQRAAIRRLIHRLRPSLVTTSNPVYVAMLRSIRTKASVLPLFGNVPVSAEDPWIFLREPAAAGGITPENRDDWWIALFFGGLHGPWRPEPLLGLLQKAARTANKHICLVLAGRAGSTGEATWRRMEGDYAGKITFLNLGELPAPAISAWLRAADFGIAASPWQLIGKSGTVAAMLDHGLPVIVTRDDYQPYVPGDAPPSSDPLVHRLDAALPEKLVAGLPKRPAQSHADAVAVELLAALKTAVSPPASTRPLKILLSSYVFSPSVGGIETVSALITPEFVRAGHEVILITHTAKDDGKEWPFKVIRRPGPLRLMELVRWCDVYFQNNISLTYAWPLLFIQRPWAIAHHTWIGRFKGDHDLRGQLKRFLLKYGVNITVSHAVAGDLPVPSTIVGNPYSSDVFKQRPEIPRNRQLVYLGRLVSEKGVDMIIRSLDSLRSRGLYPRLAIIGSGPEELLLRQLSRKLGVENPVDFMGTKPPAEIAQVLNAHQVLVVPSQWQEPFGIVALEGMASGCVVVAAAAGGLPEVVGTCGITFACGNQAELTDALESVLHHPEVRDRLLAKAGKHLRQFEPDTVAGKYLRVFRRGIGRSEHPWK